MAKKRTGLQSEISGIFSGVPVPKKGGKRPGADGPAPKPDGSDVTKPAAPQPATPKPVAPAAPTPPKPVEVEPVPATKQPKIPEIKVPEQKTKAAPPVISRQRKVKSFAPKAGVSSSRQKTSIIILIIFSAALVIVLARPYITSRRNTNPSQTPGTTNTGNFTRAEIKIDWPVPPVYPTDVRDPMVLGSKQQKRVETYEGLVVRGISYSEDRKYAVIGTETFQEGDVIRDTTIVEINPNSVVFEKDGKRWKQEVQGEG